MTAKSSDHTVPKRTVLVQLSSALRIKVSLIAMQLSKAVTDCRQFNIKEEFQNTQPYTNEKKKGFSMVLSKNKQLFK